jgi:hypothetical protein
LLNNPVALRIPKLDLVVGLCNDGFLQASEHLDHLLLKNVGEAPCFHYLLFSEAKQILDEYQANDGIGSQLNVSSDIALDNENLVKRQVSTTHDEYT